MGHRHHATRRISSTARPHRSSTTIHASMHSLAQPFAGHHCSRGSSPAAALVALVDLPAAGVVPAAVSPLADHPTRQRAQDAFQAHQQRGQRVILQRSTSRSTARQGHSGALHALPCSAVCCAASSGAQAMADSCTEQLQYSFEAGCRPLRDQCSHALPPVGPAN